METQYLTPEEWWRLLCSAPLIAGPWEFYRTENQRVDHMWVRRTPDYRIMVMVYGPHFSPLDPYDTRERTKWIVSFSMGDYTPLSFFHLPIQPDLAAAKEEADKKIRDAGWLVVNPEKET